MPCPCGTLSADRVCLVRWQPRAVDARPLCCKARYRPVKSLQEPALLLPCVAVCPLGSPTVTTPSPPCLIHVCSDPPPLAGSQEARVAPVPANPLRLPTPPLKPSVCAWCSGCRGRISPDPELQNRYRLAESRQHCLAAAARCCLPLGSPSVTAPSPPCLELLLPSCTARAAQWPACSRVVSATTNSR